MRGELLYILFTTIYLISINIPGTASTQKRYFSVKDWWPFQRSVNVGMPSPHLEFFINNVKETYHFSSWKAWHWILKRKYLFDHYLRNIMEHMILSKCLGKFFKPSSYLQPHAPSLVPNSMSFIAKWPFPTQRIFQSLICSKANQPTYKMYSSVSFGCLQTIKVIMPKAKDRDGHINRKKEIKKDRDGHIIRKKSGLPTWLNPKLQWRVERKKLEGLSFAARQGKEVRDTVQPWRDCAQEEKAFQNHSNDRRERSWTRGDEYMAFRFSLGPWCRFHLEPCSSANFHSAWALLKMNSTHSCFDADCMVHFCAFIKGNSEHILASQG